jgi:acyl carrier protein
MLSTQATLVSYTDQIRGFLAANFYITDAEALKDDTSLIDRGVIDSTGVLEVIGFIEETFGITVEDNELLPENLDSIQGIARFVTRKKS